MTSRLAQIVLKDRFVWDGDIEIFAAPPGNH